MTVAIYGMRYRPRELPAADPAVFVRAGIENAPTAPKRIEAILYAPATAVRPNVGQWATIEEVDDGRCRLRMTSDSLDWPALALGSVGAEFEVVHPPELVEHIREWAARFTRATSPT